MTKKILISVATLAALAGCSDTTEPGTAELAPQGNVEQVELDTSATLDDAANVNTEAVTYTWKLSEHPDIAAAPQPYRDMSRQYRLVVNGRQLASGVELPLTQASALIALSPVGAQAIVAPEHALQHIALDTTAGLLADGAGVAALADGRALSEVGDFTMNPNMIAFKTAPDVGAGPVTLRIADANPDAVAVVQVVEKNSPYALDFGADAMSYFRGETIHFDGSWSGDVRSAEVLSARMRAPNGQVVDVPVSDTGEVRLEGSADVPDLQLRPGELMELEVDTVATTADGTRVRRTAKTAFAIATRTATLQVPTPTLERSADGITVPVELEVGSEGRYAVTGILYGTDASGEMKAFLGCQTATMLDPGTQTLNLTFSAADLESSELRAPYEIRDLRLQDQSRMYVLDD